MLLGTYVYNDVEENSFCFSKDKQLLLLDRRFRKKISLLVAFVGSPVCEANLVGAKNRQTLRRDENLIYATGGLKGIKLKAEDSPVVHH